MSKKWITSILEDVKNASRINREKATDIVWDNPEIFKDLVEMTFDVDFAFRSRLMQRAAGAAFDIAMRKVASAFESRAATLYRSGATQAGVAE